MKTINLSFKFGLVLTLSSIIVSCTGNSENSEDARIAQLEAKIEQLQSNQTTTTTSSSNYSSSNSYSSHSEEKRNNFNGTYRVTDELNTTWTITLNDDETAIVESSDGNKYYGSWEVFPYDVPCFSFSYKDYPYLEFPSGRENINYGIISDGYLYSSNTNYKAKNPKYRLPIKKIK